MTDQTYSYSSTSIRDNQSQAFQQIHRINPVLVDFQGAQAKHDRQRLLLYRIFEDRLNVPQDQIKALLNPTLKNIYGWPRFQRPQHEAKRAEFIEAWPYSPVLMRLLEDQVLVATEAQETRDLIRILVDLFKTRGENRQSSRQQAFDISNEKGSVTSLLSSVANQLHRTLLEKARRNLGVCLSILSVLLIVLEKDRKVCEFFESWQDISILSS